MCETIKINYSIGKYWPTGAVATYMISNTEVFNGTIEEAKSTLEYVKKQSPDNDWRIFQLIQLLHDK